jgi:thioredoxin-related protein
MPSHFVRRTLIDRVIACPTPGLDRDSTHHLEPRPFVFMRRLVAIAVLVVLLASGCGPSGASNGNSRVEKLRKAVVEKVAPKPAKVEQPEVKFYDDLAAAQREAAASGKPMLLVFAAQWCFHSRQLTTEVLPDTSVRHLTDRFICVRIDVDHAPELCDEYRVRAYPTLIFTSPTGVVLQRLTGAQASDVVAQEMTATLASLTERLAMPPPTNSLKR